MDKAVNRLIASDQRAYQDDDDNEDAREVFHAAVAVGEGPRRLPSREHESDPERNRGRCVANVVDRIGKQCDAARNRYHGNLQRGGDRQNDERPFDREDAPVGCRDCRINKPVRMPARVGPIMAVGMMVPGRGGRGGDDPSAKPIA